MSTERVVVNLLRFAARPDHSELTTPHLIRLLSVLSSVPAAVLTAFGQRITSGVVIFLETHAEHIRDSLSWQVVMRCLLHFVHHRRAAPQAFTALTYCLDHHTSYANFSPLLSALLAFTTPTNEKGEWCPVRTSDVLQAMLKLHSKLATLTVTAADSTSPRALYLHTRSDRSRFRVCCLQWTVSHGAAPVVVAMVVVAAVAAVAVAI